MEHFARFTKIMLELWNSENIEELRTALSQPLPEYDE
jgi:hypothetical protein